MTVTESLRPTKSQRIIDLVAAAGLDVTPWGLSNKGQVRTPASNPAYCYEWAFVERDRVVILNVWHGELEERDGRVWCDLNPRAYSEVGRNATTLQPSQRGTLAKRAISMDQAIAHAFEKRLPVRLIVGAGLQRDIFNPESKTASRMNVRLLDPEPWSVDRYNRLTGECHLSRGSIPRYVDQYTTPEPHLPLQHDVSGKIWERDRKVRDAALLRAGGKCELCNKPGFRMAGGGIYLETHHVVPLSENGTDHESNVAAICPNDHREAHHGERRELIRSELLAMLAKIYR